MHHCIRFPHHGLENSRTFHDLSLKFPGLSTFRDQIHFPGLSSAWKF